MLSPPFLATRTRAPVSHKKIPSQVLIHAYARPDFPVNSLKATAIEPPIRLTTIIRGATNAILTDFPLLIVTCDLLLLATVAKISESPCETDYQ